MILRPDQVALYFPGYNADVHVALWQAAEHRVARMARRTFLAGTKTEYPQTFSGRLYPEDGPIAAAGLVVTDLVANRVMTADTRLGANDGDYVLMFAGQEGSYVDMHSASYEIGEIKLEYPGGYAVGEAPESVKQAVGLAMMVLQQLQTSAGVGSSSVGGESYDFSGDEWRQVRALLSPFVRYAV